MPLRYVQRKPSPALDSVIECHWLLSGDPDMSGAPSAGGVMPVGVDSSPERVLPDGRVELVFNLGGPVWQTLDAATVRQPAELLVGPTTRAVFIQPTGAIRMIGVRLRHGAAGAILGVPASELTDAMHPIGDIAAFPSSLSEQLRETEDVDGSMAALERVLLDRLGRARHRTVPSTTRAARLLLSSGGSIDVASIASGIGISTRQLARRFGRDIGVGPKLFARLARFHSLLRLVDSARPRTLAAAAAGAGYADQSHLVRDFREFAGLSPTSYFRSSHQLTDYFLDLDSAEG